MSAKLIIVCQSLDEPSALRMQTSLAQQGIKTDIIRSDSQQYALNSFLESRAIPSTLLITDNFLKDKYCLYEFLDHIPAMVKTGKGLLIITDFTSPDGSTQTTRVNNVSDAFKLMEYWQKVYISYRKLKNTPDSSMTNDEVHKVREISNKIGDVINFIRESPHLDYNRIAASNFKEVATQLNIPTGAPIELSHTKVKVKQSKETQQETNNDENVDFDQLLFQNTAFTNIKKELPNTSYLSDESSNPTPEPIALNEVNAIISNASQMIEDGRVNYGINRLEDVVDQYPEQTQALYYLAYYLAKEKQAYEKAIQYLERLVKLQPNNPYIYFLAAEINELEENFEQALTYYKKVKEIDPNYEKIDYRIGVLYHDQIRDDEKQATKYLKDAVKADVNNADAIYRLGTLLNEYYQKPDKAIKYFQRTLKLEPNHPFAHYDLALIYHQRGLSDLAADHYKNAIALNPELKTELNDAAFLWDDQDVLMEDSVESTFHIIDEDEWEDDENVSTTPSSLPDSNPPAIEVSETPVPPQSVATTQEVYVQLDYTPSSTTKKTKPSAVEQSPYQPLSKNKKTEVVVITGATSGIGLATARLYAQRNYNLLLTGRSSNKLKSIQEELERKYDIKVYAETFDVRYPEEIDETLLPLLQNELDVSILINNAGVARGLNPIHEGTIEDWDAMIDTNVKGLLYVTRLISPGMVAKGAGHIVNIGSVAGKEVYTNGNVYNASKHAVDALTRAMRLDLYKYNIRVSQVSPGHVEGTNFALSRFHGDKQKADIYKDFQPLKAFDVAEVIYFITQRPDHVNIQDVLLFGTQQASATDIDRSGR